MRLAVFTSQFPSRVSTFFARDMRALIEAGIDVDIFAIYEHDSSLWRYVPEILNETVLPRERVHHIPLKQALRESGLSLISRFGKQTAAIATSAVGFGANPLAKSMYVLPKALAWSKQYPDSFDHVLAYWGNYAATCAYAYAKTLKKPLPFSFFLHAGTDLYRDQVFLKQKLVAARHVFTISEFNRNFLRQRYPELFPALDQKLHIYQLGLDFKELPFQPEQRLPHRIIAVGNFAKAKGFDYLIRAGKVLKDRGCDFEIELVGDGPQKAELQSLIKELGLENQVIFSGWLPFEQVRNAMLKATLLVHPSPGIGDGVPTVIKEAMALGTPVVASDVSGIPEALAGGKYGILVPPKDVNALANAIARMIDEPELRRQFATGARAFAEEIYDLWRNGQELASILQSGKAEQTG